MILFSYASRDILFNLNENLKNTARSRRTLVQSSLLDSTRLGPTLWLCQSFTNLWKLFPKVPSGTGNFPKASESSSRQSEPSLGFLCDSQIVIAVLYKYEALPLQKSSSLLPLILSQSETKSKT